MHSHDDVILVFSLTWGDDCEIPLQEWMRRGPTQRLPLMSPIAAKSKSTGQRLSLRVVPLSYRNTALSRLLIRLRVIATPKWGDAGSSP